MCAHPSLYMHMSSGTTRWEVQGEAMSVCVCVCVGVCVVCTGDRGHYCLQGDPSVRQ